MKNIFKIITVVAFVSTVSVFAAGENTITQLQSYLVKVSSGDTTPGKLFDKLVAGSNIIITKNNPGGNETISISSTGGGSSSSTIINGVNATNFTFATGTDTNLKLTISTSTGTVTWTPSWSGVLAINRGGLATTTAPSLGQILIGNASGGYDLKATSSLGLPSGTVTSVSATTPTGLTVSSTTCTAACLLSFALQAGYVIPLTASTTEWATAYGSTTALTPAYIRGLFSNTATGLTYSNSTGVTSLTGGYVIPLSASTTEWSSFYTTPSTRITAGTNLSWSGNTLNATLSGGSFSTSSINGLATTTFIFSTSSDTNIGLAISTSTTGVLFTPQWIGTLADGRISSASTWNAKLGQFFQTASGSALTIGNLFSTSTFSFLNASGTGLTATNIYGNLYPTGISNSFVAVDPTGKLVATSTPGGTTYTGTYPIIVSGSVISTGFSTSTINNYTAQNNFTTASATTAFTTPTLYFTNASSTGGLTVGSLYSSNQYVTGLSSTFLAADPNGKIIATSTPAVGGGGTVTSVSLVPPTGLSAASTTCNVACVLTLSLTGGYVIPLIASTTEWATAYASSTAASIRAQFSNTVTGLTYTSATGVTSLTSGYNIPLSASTTEWANFYATPSTRITAGANCSWAGNTFNCPPGSGTFSTSSINGLATTTFTFATTSTGGDFSISTTTAGVFFNLPTASASNRGALSSTDWTTFNNKIGLSNLSATYPLIYNNGTGAFSTGFSTSTTNVFSNAQTINSLLTVTGTSTFATTTQASSTITNLNVPNFLSFASGSSTGAFTTGGQFYFGNASGTGLTSGSIFSSNYFVGGLASTFLAADPIGKIIATTTPSGSLSGGTNGLLARWTSASTLSSGVSIDNGTVAGINATSSTINFLVKGTGTNGPFSVASSSNSTLFHVSANKNTGIATSTFSTTNPELLKIDATGVTTENPISTVGSINDFFQNLITNYSTGNAAESGFTAQNASSTATTTFAWFGINGSGYATSTTYSAGAANDTTLIANGGDLHVVNSSSGKSINFITGGTSTTTNTALSINGSGVTRVWKGLADSTNATGTSGQVLSSTGTSTLWITPSAGGSGNAAFTIGSGKIYNATSTDNVGIGTSSPNSTLEIGGSFAAFSVATSSNNFTMGSATHYVYTGNGTSTFTLPALSSTVNRIYFIKNRATSTLTIQRAGSDLLYVAATTTRYQIGAGGSARIINDGTYWDVE